MPTSHRFSKYLSHETDKILKNITCPVPYTQINEIEQYNDFRKNVFIFDQNEDISPLYILNREDEDVINLLLLEETEGNQHYIYIKHFSRLFGHLTNHQHKTFYCYRCLHRFSSEELLKEHKQCCKNHQIQIIKMPSEKQNKLFHQSAYAASKILCYIRRLRKLIKPRFLCHSRSTNIPHSPNSSPYALRLRIHYDWPWWSSSYTSP